MVYEQYLNKSCYLKKKNTQNKHRKRRPEESKWQGYTALRRIPFKLLKTWCPDSELWMYLVVRAHLAFKCNVLSDIRTLYPAG